MVDPIELNDALERVSAFLDGGDLAGAVDYLRTLHPADSAEILAELEPEEQASIVDRLQVGELAEVFEQLDEDEMAEVAQHLDVEMLADVLDEMEPDMAADLLGELEPEQAAEVLEQMEEPADVASLMTFAPDTAGGIMTSPPPSLRRFWTVAEATSFLRKHYEEEEDFFYLYVLDRHARLIGLVNLKSIILAGPEQTVEEIMTRNVISVRASADQEEVAQLLQRYDLVSLPVVDEEERLAVREHVLHRLESCVVSHGSDASRHVHRGAGDIGRLLGGQEQGIGRGPLHARAQGGRVGLGGRRETPHAVFVHAGGHPGLSTRAVGHHVAVQ